MADARFEGDGAPACSDPHSTWAGELANRVACVGEDGSLWRNDAVHVSVVSLEVDPSIGEGPRRPVEADRLSRDLAGGTIDGPLRLQRMMIGQRLVAYGQGNAGDADQQDRNANRLPTARVALSSDN